MDFLRSKGLVSKTLLVPSVSVDEAALMSTRGTTGLVIDDMTSEFPAAPCGGAWSESSDRVMGGVSEVRVCRERISGRSANVLRGGVDTRNNGGFVQMGLDLARDGGLVDASEFDGVRLVVSCPRAETYNLHLRTPDCARVFSSYRATFVAQSAWTEIDLPWSSFAGNGPGAVDTPLDPSSLRRLGLLGIGRIFRAELALADLRFYKAH